MASIQFSSSDTTTWEERFGDGSDGALTISSNTTDTTAKTTCSGSSGSTTLLVGSATGFANGNLVLIHQTRNGGDGAGNWMLNKISSGADTTSWTMKYALTNNFNTKAQVYLLKQYSSVTIDASKTLSASVWDFSKGGILAYLCTGATTITGSISADGSGFYGAQVAGSNPSYAGESSIAEPQLSQSNNGSGGGGGGNSLGGGGGGGYGTGGTGGGGTGGTGGATVGNASLTTLLFGGSGGAGGSVSGSQAFGKASGGIVLIISDSITVTGGITSTGVTGGAPGIGSSAGGGGGGAGGAILLKGRAITLGTNLVTALGGNGGSGTGSGNSGGAGGSGRIHADYITLTGTTNPTLDSTQDFIFTTTSTSTSSTTSTSTTSTSTTTTMSVTTSTSTTSTSTTTTSTSSSTSTTSTSSSTSTTTTLTSTSTTLDLRIVVENV